MRATEFVIPRRRISTVMSHGVPSYMSLRMAVRWAQLYLQLHPRFAWYLPSAKLNNLQRRKDAVAVEISQVTILDVVLWFAPFLQSEIKEPSLLASVTLLGTLLGDLVAQDTSDEFTE